MSTKSALVNISTKNLSNTDSDTESTSSKKNSNLSTPSTVEKPKKSKFYSKNNKNSLDNETDDESNFIKIIEKKDIPDEIDEEKKEIPVEYYLEKYKSLGFSPKINQKNFKNHFLKVKSGISYLINSLNGPSEEYIEKHKIYLPPKDKRKKKTLVLDLDETLIHLINDSNTKPDAYISLNGYNNKIRPYCLDFLKNMSKLYEIYLFTASDKTYAESIVNYLDPKAQLIEGIISRNHCLKTKAGYMIKDLRIIKNRNIKDLILVDNLSHSFGKSINNGIPILEFIDDEKDEELLYLQHYLEKLAGVNDVREINKEVFNLESLAKINSKF